MKFIKLTRGKVAIVDDADYEVIMPYKWRYMSDGYVMGYVNGKNIQLHNYLLGVKGIDHINRDRLDNRRANLREATPSQNLANKTKQRNSKSPYKGVTRHKFGKWQAKAKGVYLGLFDNPMDAALAYDVRMESVFGDYAATNRKLGLL